MSNLPNSDKDRIKVYPNEYISNSTINRPNLRLLQNDLYLEKLWNDAISGIIHIAGLINHNDLIGVTPNQHHPQIHTIFSHDTTATGADLTQLTNGSNADTLHNHSATTNHGTLHIDGTDQIPTVTTSNYGIMSPTLYNQLENVYSTVESDSGSWDNSSDLNSLSGKVNQNINDIQTLSSQITGNQSDINYLSGYISGNLLSASIFVDAPNNISANGNDFNIAVNSGYLYIYSPSGSLNWGRIPLDYTW